MHTALRLVRERLPQLGEQVGRLFEGDDTFRELCEEYELCVETTVRMEVAASANRALHDEYVALRLRLEGELLRYLAEHLDSSGAVSRGGRSQE
jgi:hypothetical protein